MDQVEQVQGKRKRKANPHRQLNIADLLSKTSDVEEDFEEEKPKNPQKSKKSIKKQAEIEKIQENPMENGENVDEMDNFDNLAEILGIKETKPEIFGGFSMSYGAEVPFPMTSSDSSSPRRRTLFSVNQETLHIFRFLLDQVRSQSEGREGRVAKRKVETSSLEIWEKYKKYADGNKDANAYRVIYRTHSSRLFDLPGLSLSEKVDLFYALDIKVPKNVRQKLIDTFHVEITDDGIVSGRQLRNHWDLIHPDSDRDEDSEDFKNGGGNKKDRGWNRFTEKDDGLMWEYVLEHVQNHSSQFQSMKKVWEQFKRNYKNRGALQKRSGQTYSQRFVRILAPNLHKMPFDIETKAAIYENTGITVPEEFREKLISETGVEISDEGTVTKYSNRPEKLVLQSKQIDDVIGITSGNRISTLTHPKNNGDSNPFTPEEDHQIWDYILRKFRTEPGKAFRAKKRLSGWSFWREFIKETGSNRTWQSLCQHFNEDLQDQVMATDYVLNTKIELFFILNVPLDEEDKKIIEEATTSLILNEQGGISFAAGKGFRIGKLRDSSPRSHENSEDVGLNLAEILKASENGEIDVDDDTIPKILEKLAKLENFPGKMTADFDLGNHVEEFNLDSQETSNQMTSHRFSGGRQPKDDVGGTLTNDNLRDFMNKIAMTPVEKVSRKEKTFSLWKNNPFATARGGGGGGSGGWMTTGPSTSTFKNEYEDQDYAGPRTRSQSREPLKKRSRPSLRHCPENAETCKKVEEILKNAVGIQKSPQEVEEDLEDYTLETSFRPINLEILAENAAKLLEEGVKQEPIDDYEDSIGNYPQNHQKNPKINNSTHFQTVGAYLKQNGIEEKRKSSMSARNAVINHLNNLAKNDRKKLQKNGKEDLDDDGSNSTRIAAAFTNFESEIQKFAEILEIEGKQLSGEEKLIYLEKIEAISKTFRITAKDALTRF